MLVGRIEHGDRPLRAEEILKLAEIFDVSTDFILGKKSVNVPKGRNALSQT